MNDPIDKAIEASEAERRIQQQVNISSTGRYVLMDFPILTDQELLEFIGWLSIDLRRALAVERQRAERGSLIVARSLPQPPPRNDGN